MANEHEHHHGTMPVAQAIEATKNWRDYLKASNNPFDLKSFWVDIKVIKALLERNPEADGICTYLGLENAEDPTSFKIVTLATQNGVDIIELPNGQSDIAPPPIYCPPICPTGGVLNG